MPHLIYVHEQPRDGRVVLDSGIDGRRVTYVAETEVERLREALRNIGAQTDEAWTIEAVTRALDAR